MTKNHIFRIYSILYRRKYTCKGVLYVFRFFSKNSKIKWENHLPKKGDTDYVYYEYNRIYDKTTKKTNPKRATIGKKSNSDPAKMQQNENYFKYFPNEDITESIDRTARSNCLRIGSWLVIRKIIEEYKLIHILDKYINNKDLGLVLDLAAYSIITEGAVGK